MWFLKKKSAFQLFWCFTWKVGCKSVSSIAAHLQISFGITDAFRPNNQKGLEQEDGENVSLLQFVQYKASLSLQTLLMRNFWMKRHLGSWQGLNEQQKESFSFLCSFLSGERKSEVLFCTFVASADLPKEDVLHYVWSSPLYALTFPDAFGTVNLWDFSFCILIRWVCGRYLKKKPAFS